MTRLDIAITLLVSAFAVYVMSLHVGGTVIDGETMSAPLVAVPLILLVTLPLLARSQAPVLGLALSLVALALHGVAFQDAFRCGPVYLLAFFMAYSAAVRLPLGEALLGLVLAITACMVMAAAGDGETGLVLQPVVLVLWGAGRLVRSRTRMNAELDERTAALRSVRDERARLDVALDRARLSTELDELLKRRLATLAQLAEDGADLRDPGAAGATLAEIERESRRTLEEMRDLVGALRSEDGAAAVVPPPTLAGVDALLVRARGATGKLRVAGDPRALPPGVELSAYRVIEHLLDALADAPDVEVEVAFEPDSLGLRVSGQTRRRDLGPALERARERVQLHRGTLSTSRRGGRAEACAQLPVGTAA
ncbi:MAG TPA: hypothetical protein VM266_03785 [Solirubrobacteraceae bacterium]|nr:hypothetical protein [Solirubrobacteraceae bacterium]